MGKRFALLEATRRVNGYSPTDYGVELSSIARSNGRHWTDRESKSLPLSQLGWRAEGRLLAPIAEVLRTPMFSRVSRRPP